MKIKFIFLFFLCSIQGYSQEFKILEALQKNDTDFFDYEDYEMDENGNLKPVGDLIFLKGCSWYCGGMIHKITATSELPQQGDITYTAQNAHDFEQNTAWIEGKEGYGIGESITYRIDFRDNELYEGQLGINKLIVANGYKKSEQAWKNNTRIKKLQMYVNEKPYYSIHLKDAFEIQIVPFDTILFPKNQVTSIRFEIKEVYKGAIYKDTALSLLMFDGVGVH